MSLKKTLIGIFIAGSLGVVAQSQAALVLGDSFDGDWMSSDWQNRGWVVDVITRPSGDKVVYMFGAVFNAAGETEWVVATPGIGEFESGAVGADLITLAGATFNGDENPVPVPFGTVDFQFNSCHELEISIHPNADTGYQPVEKTLQPAQFLATPGTKPGCVYDTAFAGCPAGTTAGAAPRSCVLSGIITRDMILTNDTTWILEGLVQVGNFNADSATLTIEPGTVVTGSGDTADYLYVNPGSKLIADGKPNAPIIFTSPSDGVTGGNPQPKDWGGVVLSGNAPNNKCNAASPCRSEFNEELMYGGDDPHDNSGVLRYVQVRYAGYVFQTDKEVNAITAQSVGDGTIIEYVQAYRGGDDGIEFFGGTANARHLVVTEGGDDAIDWDEGWSGKVQFGLIENGTGLGEDNGFEGASQADDHDALPRAVPRLANITLIGSSTDGDGVQVKEGSGGLMSNLLVTGYNRDGKACLAVVHPETSALPPEQLALDHSWLNCTTNFRDDSDAAAGSAEALFNAGTGNRSGAVSLVGGFLPAPGSPLSSGGRAVTEDGFFTPAPYIGAFRDANDNWTRGWTYRVND